VQVVFNDFGAVAALRDIRNIWSKGCWRRHKV